MKTIKTVLHTYCYNISNPDDAKAYDELREKLCDGRHWMNCISAQKEYKPESGPIELETEFLFANQWNTTNGLRVFDWYEEVCLYNPNIKSGHWLEITDEMKEVRRNTFICGYCGYQEYNEAGVKRQEFCDSCLGSPYLKQEELHLLRMLPVELHFPHREELTKEESDYLLPLYTEAQAKKRVRDIQMKRAEIQESRNKKIAQINTEADGMLWLMDHDINIENVIYYGHTNKFSFGWRSPITSEEVKKELEKSLVGFPFEFEIKG